MIVFWFVMIVILICFSAFFSASEMVFSSANRMRLEKAAESKSRSAALALRIVDHFDDTLSSVLVGNNLVNIATSSIGSLIAVTLWGESWTWVMTAVLTVTVIIFGETMPKIIAKKNANKLALILCFPIRFLSLILKPVTLLVVGLVNLIMLILPKPCNKRSEEEAQQELQSIIETAEDENVLDEDQSELLQAAMQFDDIMVSQVMTARVDVEAIDIEDSLEEMMQTVSVSPFSRIPVYEDSIDHIVGILSQNRLYSMLTAGTFTDIPSILEKPVCLYKTTKLPAALKLLRESGQRLGVVIDEYGGTLGIFTVEDMMEELVGEIWDENDPPEEEDMVEHADGIYECDGDMHIYEFADIMEWNSDDMDIESETVGGMTVELWGTFPREGDTVRYKNAEIKVLQTEGMRVLRVLATLLNKEEDGEEEE